MIGLECYGFVLFVCVVVVAKITRIAIRERHHPDHTPTDEAMYH